MTEHTTPRNHSDEDPNQPTQVRGETVAKASRTGTVMFWPGIVMATVAIVVILFFVLR